jgi:type II secretory pathway pseudopilin PulG
MKARTSGFTLVEVVIIATILSIFASIVGFSALKAYQMSRDVDRQADLRTLQAAVELYKQRNGRYPEGCNGSGNWSGQLGSSFQCSDGSTQYIENLAPAFIPTLPFDKRLPDANAGYVYKTNAAGTVYKIQAYRTVESETVDYNHVFKSCDATNSATGICDEVYPSNNKPNHCQETDSIFRATYALWGGYASINDAIEVERQTEDIICE